MIDIEQKIRAMSAELAAAERRVGMCGGFETEESAAAEQRVEVAKVRLALLCDLRDEGLGRFPAAPGTDDPLADYCEVRPDFERTMVLTITESLEDSVHSWDCTVRMPDGRVLVGSLDDDMPQTPGDAVKSAGVMLDAELALERWNELHLTKTANVSEGEEVVKDARGRPWDDMTR